MKKYWLFNALWQDREVTQMHIEIDVCVANDSKAHERLDQILAKILDGWHLWDTSRHLNSSQFESTTWIRDRGTKGHGILELFRMSKKREAWDSGLHNRRIRVTHYPVNEDELIPQDAALLAEQPLRILVEDKFSDGSFVERIVDELDKSLSKLWSRNGSPICFVHGGGINRMPKEVESRVGENSFRPRLLAIADSDKKAPDCEESNGAQKLREACIEYDISCWILAKRAAENYLPSVLLREYKPENQEHARLIDAWEELGEDQKNFYDMKKGLPEDRDDVQFPLYKGVSDSDYDILKGGFGRKIHECWKKNIDIEIETELRNRSQGDLEYGIDLIRKEV